MSHYENLQVDRDDRGVWTICLDLAGKQVNTFNEPILRDLMAALDQIEQDDSAKLLVIRSAKEIGFVVGADVNQIEKLETTEQADFALKSGQDLFQRIEDLKIPTVAAVHGNCLGGGLEISLACQYRIVRDDASTKMGLPETQLGVIPGWGGTQRLPRRVGLQKAAPMILTGSTMNPSKAIRSGLADAVAAADSFDQAIATFVDQILAGKPPAKHSPGLKDWFLDGTSLGRSIVMKMARKQIARQAKHYPALDAALNAIETGYKQGLPAGFAKERAEFCRVLFTPTCRNLLGLFFQREKARSAETWVTTTCESGPKIKTIAVLGAGTMGAGIAQLAATSGYRVILKEIDEATARKGMEQITSLTEKGVKKGAIKRADADKALAAITPTADMAAVKQADLVIEAIVERMDIKQQVFRELDEQLPADALLVSNTSSLSISEMASVTGRGGKVAGLHFFNPVHKLPLVEVVRANDTSDDTIATLVNVVKKLGKTPLVVNEGPGFLVNRILFPYFDEAVRLVVEGHPIAEVDKEAKRFGMPMGPLELMDTVGLDVGADVASHLPIAGAEESPTPKHLAEMVAQGRRGQKSGKGFYDYTNGKRGEPMASAISGIIPKLPSPKELGGEMLSGVQQRLILSIVNAAGQCLEDGIVSEPWMVDLGMVLGTGFAPFRGGPINLSAAWGHDKLSKLLFGLVDLCGPRFQPSPYFLDSKVPVSQ
ncbi:MAG: enoyl-CoA hydratase/isomerase family protein [Planctomycetaceae bacterium]|nr:enoyl-CoA hydratase/isomerase family protein [Planctomycetaceae bacterium]